MFPFHAQQSADQLAAEVDACIASDASDVRFASVPAIAKTSLRVGSLPVRSVSFSSQIDLVICHEHEIHHEVQTQLPIQQFQQWTSKPWQLRPQPYHELLEEPLSNLAVLISAASCSMWNDPLSQENLQDLLIPQFEVPIPSDEENAPEADDGYSPSMYDPATHERSSSSDDDDDAEANPDPQRQHQPAQPEHLQSVVVYRLHVATRHVFLDWGSYERMVLHLAQLYSISPHDVAALHGLAVVPPGQPIHAESIILQHIDDIPIGHTDQLLLVDVRTHPSKYDFADNQVTQDRRVHCMPPIMTRTQFLQNLRIARYCQHERQRCLVKHNGEFWNLHDLRARVVHHGDFLKVTIPPPTHLHEPTVIAIWYREAEMTTHAIRQFRKRFLGTADDSETKRPRTHHSSDQF
eukprot:s283_g7.t1